MNKIPIILDCDPGIDDAMAIFMALASDELDIKALTVTSGNQTITKTSNNAINLVDYAGYDVKVAKGSLRPLHREIFVADYVHGESGLGTVILPKSTKNFYTKNAFETIYEEALNCNGELRIIATAPLTNIATTLLLYPDIKNKIHSITLMGGAIRGGNDSPAAEFNIYADPEAARIVFESGIPLTMVGLDVTNNAFILEEEIKELTSSNSKISNVLNTLLSEMLELYTKAGFNGAIMHDSLAVAYVIDNTILKTQKYHVDIETQGELTRGKTVVDIHGVTKKAPNTNVGISVNRNAFIELIKRLFKKYN